MSPLRSWCRSLSLWPAAGQIIPMVHVDVSVRSAPQHELHAHGALTPPPWTLPAEILTKSAADLFVAPNCFAEVRNTYSS